MPDSASTALSLGVVDVPAASRFELLLHGERVGLADYAVVGDVLTVPHVETEPEHRGQGFAAALMDGVIESIRASGQRIRPVCPYAAAYIRRRPGLEALVAGPSSEKING